ncbi:MAG: dual specificity protein phosphatase family protein [Methylococcales bacterium]|nr:dual specificity protein phosphatase family protein [Methylococcales bacterium]
MKPDIYIVEIIGSGFLAVMAKPVSGEWIEDEFLGIAKAGIKQIVSLLEIHEEYEVGLQNEGKLAEHNCMEFISFPIQDRGIPNSVNEFSKVTKKLYQEIADGKNTVIHCRAGIGRTGIVAAGVLLHCGFEPDAAFRLISAKRGIQVPDTDEQRNWILSNYDVITNSSLVNS